MPNSMDGFTPLPAGPGLYDQLIDQQLHDQLAALAQAQLAPGIKKVDPTELPDRVGELVSRALASVTINLTTERRLPLPSHMPSSASSERSSHKLQETNGNCLVHEFGRCQGRQHQ